MELKKVETRDKSWEEVHTFGFEEGRSATEISTAVRLMAAAAREWALELGVITCSQAGFRQCLPREPEHGDEGNEYCTGASKGDLREQIGGKYDVWFQETRISGIPCDKSIKQGGKESPCLFNLMMRSVFRVLQAEWKEKRVGGQDKEQ